MRQSKTHLVMLISTCMMVFVLTDFLAPGRPKPPSGHMLIPGEFRFSCHGKKAFKRSLGKSGLLRQNGPRPAGVGQTNLLVRDWGTLVVQVTQSLGHQD